MSWSAVLPAAADCRVCMSIAAHKEGNPYDQQGYRRLAIDAASAPMAEVANILTGGG
eukprot:SAG31_NODE_3924_length_3748_cov_2.446150_2_plen_57_part_00